jgi:hypothetical protein
MYRTDIRKPATQKAQIQRPMTSQSATNSGTPSEVRSADLAQYTEPVSDDEEDEGNRHIATTSHEAAWADVDPQAAAEARAFREAQSKMQKGPGGQPDQSHLTAAVPSAPKELFMKLTPANLSKLVQSRYELERDTGLNESQDSRANNGNASGSGISLVPGRVEYVSSFRAQEGKKIAVPVRVEPKVFYANERTSGSPVPTLSCEQTPRADFARRAQLWHGSSSRLSYRQSESASSPTRIRMVSPLSHLSVGSRADTRMHALPQMTLHLLRLRPLPEWLSSPWCTPRACTGGASNQSGALLRTFACALSQVSPADHLFSCNVGNAVRSITTTCTARRRFAALSSSR